MKRFFVFIVLLSFTQFACAHSFADLWKTKDQQGFIALKNHEAKKAAALFDRPDWRAVAQYRQGDYQAALSYFEAINSAASLYNAGNAAAYLQEYKMAVAYYNKALALQPNFIEAKENKAIIEKFLQAQEEKKNKKTENNKSDDGSHQNKSNNNKSDQQKQQNKVANSADESKGQQSEASHSADESQGLSLGSKQQKKNQTAGEEPRPNKDGQSEQETQTNKKTSETTMQTTVSDAEQPIDVERQATMQWLHQIPDDPGGLLRQKFLRDHQRYISGS